MFRTFFRLVVCLVILLVGGATLGFAQPAADQTATADFAGVPVEKWVGKVFVVLPLEQSDKADGYPFILAKPVPELLAGKGSNVRAEWLEGKKLEVLAVEIKAIDQKYSLINDYLITFKELSIGTVLTAMALGGQVPQIVLYDDFINAEKYFTGKTVYSKQPTIPVYSTEPGFISVKVDEPLKVADVIPGVTAAEPIWLAVTTPGGQKGYITINYSNTNMYLGMWKKEKPWLTDILEKNPRELYSWDEATWAAINEGTLKIGMLPEQVRFMWDEPLVICHGNVADEQVWIYPSKLLKFNATGLYSIEER